MDKIYTPAGLAARLVASCEISGAEIVADFAAGDGALLAVAAARWPKASKFASDIDDVALSKIARTIDGCKTCVCDFFDDMQRNLDPILQHLRGSCDVVLLNPPFSGRGGRRYKVVIRGREMAASKGLAFVCHSLGYVRKGGEVLAILPASCVTSERDAPVMRALGDVYTITQVGESLQSAFYKRSVAVVILRIRLERPGFSKAKTKITRVNETRYGAEIMRGTTPMHQSTSEGHFPVVHTRNLRAGQLVGGYSFVEKATRYVVGPAILMQRVGRPCVGKVVIKGSQSLVPSDCVVALRTFPAGYELELANLIRSEWQHIQKCFGGSCAPFLTVSGLQAQLARLGISSRQVRDMTLPPAPLEKPSASVHAIAINPLIEIDGEYEEKAAAFG